MAFDNNVPLAANQIAADLAAINANWELVARSGANTDITSLAGPALGTPASGTLTSCTGLPAAGVVGTALVVGGALGTPASGTLTNCTGLPLTGLVATAWTTPAFNAGDFTAEGAMTWTVEAGDVITYSYIIIGKTMFINFNIDLTTVGGTLSSMLFIAIPAGKVATKLAKFVYALSEGTGWLPAIAQVNVSGTTISLYKDMTQGGNFTAGTDTHYTSGSLVFEIN